jgi:hypothetical protein
MHIYTDILHNLETLVGQKIWKELGQQWMPRAKEIFLRAIFDTRAIGSLAVV